MPTFTLYHKAQLLNTLLNDYYQAITFNLKQSPEFMDPAQLMPDLYANWYESNVAPLLKQHSIDYLQKIISSMPASADHPLHLSVSFSNTNLYLYVLQPPTSIPAYPSTTFTLEALTSVKIMNKQQHFRLESPSDSPIIQKYIVNTPNQVGKTLFVPLFIIPGTFSPRAINPDALLPKDSEFTTKLIARMAKHNDLLNQYIPEKFETPVNFLIHTIIHRIKTINQFLATFPKLAMLLPEELRDAQPNNRTAPVVSIPNGINLEEITSQIALHRFRVRTSAAALNARA